MLFAQFPAWLLVSASLHQGGSLRHAHNPLPTQERRQPSSGEMQW